MDPSIGYPEVTGRLLGVFKGGGAKGVVYCAALHELRARGLWFAAVAGSSAGAITAALIAAGYAPDELTRLASEGLLTVRKNWFGSLRSSGDRSLFRTVGLEKWLERTLVATMPNRVADGALTFAELYQWSGIELNVVAMDLATAQPVVFNHVTSPAFGVSAAVVASSAIPIAMRPRRVAVTENDRASVHRLVDGGAWANYPRFVFADPSFRAYHGLASTDPERILGFVIESSVSRGPGRVRRTDLAGPCTGPGRWNQQGHHRTLASDLSVRPRQRPPDGTARCATDLDWASTRRRRRPTDRRDRCDPHLLDSLPGISADD